MKGSGIQDVIRRIDLAFLQYQKVVEALDPAIPTNGIEVSDPDKCMLLLRSLPGDCRSHIVLQFRRGTETYQGYVNAALDYENHQRMWADLPGGKVNELYGDSAEGADDEDDQLAKLQGGPRRSADKDTVCFNCNGKGHFSKDCPKPRRDRGDRNSSRDKLAKPKAKPGAKSGGKSKGRGKGKKAHELIEEGGEPDAEEQVEDRTAPTEEAWSEVGESEEPTRLSSMLKLAEAHLKEERSASDEAGWWMLDSGASRTVISTRYLHFYTINRSRKLNPPMVFFTASGERVEIEDEVVVVARFRMHSEPKSKTLEIRALVSDVQHNLLSVGQCVSRGWNFHYTQDEVVLETPAGDSCDVCVWSGCPWIRCKPRKAGKKVRFDVEMTDASGDTDVKMGSVCSLSDSSGPRSGASQRGTQGQGSRGVSVVRTGAGGTSTRGNFAGGTCLQGFVKEISQPQSGALSGGTCINAAVEAKKDPEELVPRVRHTGKQRPDVATRREVWPESVAGSQGTDEVPADIPLPGLEESERLVSEGTREVPDVSYERRRRTIERELEAHRRRGHYPFDVRCESCRMNKSVTRHPRKTLKQGHEVQADFFFLHGHKFLALKESDSGAVGVTAAAGEVAIREIKAFLGFLGLDGVPGAADRPLCIITDAEAAVGALLKQVPAARNFRILQAAPQAHESVGGGERAVRVLKEGYLTLAADLGRRNVQLRSEAEKAVRTVLRHVAMCYNIHGRGSASPLQLILGERALVPQSAVFSSVCFAEVPEALQEKAEDQRYLPSAYLYPEVNGLGHRVSTRLADGTVVTFTATSVKFLKETLFQPDFCPELIFWRGDQAQGQVELPAEGDAVEVLAQPMKPGFHNPPVQWYRDHGPTDGCYACEGLRRGLGTKGRVHSAKCKARYHDWVQAQRRSLEEGVPQGDEVGRLPMDVDYEPGEAMSDGYEPTIGRDGSDIMDEDFDFANPGDPSEEEPMQTEQYVEVFTSSPQEDVLGAMPRELGIQENQGLSEGILAPLYVQKEFSAKEVESYQLGGRQVYLLPPSKATTEEHQPLDIEKTVKGRRRELEAMNNLGFGKVVSAEEARQFAETHGLKIIPSRWVLGEKIIEDQPEVRARMVVQEVAHAGAGTAASLGMSSCTPSGEAVRILLSLCSTE